MLILLAAAERFGLLDGKAEWAKSIGALGASANVQAFVAVVIIGALVIGALADIKRIDVLKDIALVVVGFYFGTRRSQSTINEAVQAGTAAGIAAAQYPSTASDPGRPNDRTNPTS